MAEIDYDRIAESLSRIPGFLDELAAAIEKKREERDRLLALAIHCFAQGVCMYCKAPYDEKLVKARCPRRTSSSLK